jgi:hypothetical protein
MASNLPRFLTTSTIHSRSIKISQSGTDGGFEDIDGEVNSSQKIQARDKQFNL